MAKGCCFESGSPDSFQPLFGHVMVPEPWFGVRGGDLKENQLIGSSSPYFKIWLFLVAFPSCDSIICFLHILEELVCD